MTKEPFLQRWSRLKQQDEEVIEESVEFESNLPAVSEPDFSELTDADMPALDSLDKDSDYRPFFAPKVSVELRRLALRKLFQQPVFNARDGLCEYDDDYTQFEPLGDTITADMKYLQELAEQRSAEQEAKQQQIAEQLNDEQVQVAEQSDLPVESDDPNNDDTRAT